jgi:aconitate decarboxylase
LQVPYKGNFDRPSPSTGLEGKFSYQYHVALAVLDRKATIASFQDERAFAHDIREFMKKVTIRVDPSIPGNREFMYHRVTIRLRDGREVTGAEPRPRGHWRYPLQRPEYEGEFRENASMALQKHNVEKIIEMVDHLEDLPDVRVLTDALAVKN